MNLQQSTQKILSDLKQKNQQLLVKWNAGGDESLVNIYTLENGKEKYLNTREYELNWHITQLLDLPNAGEYYNNGSGEIYIGADQMIYFKYDELAYHTELNVKEKIIELNASVDNLKLCKQYMQGKRITEIKFYGTISFLAEKETHFSLAIHRAERQAASSFLSILRYKIEDVVLQKYKGKKKLIDINYEGVITNEKIMVEDLLTLQYSVDKENKGKIRPLFNERITR